MTDREERDAEAMQSLQHATDSDLVAIAYLVIAAATLFGIFKGWW